MKGTDAHLMLEIIKDQNSPLVLVTTSIEETWVKNEKILFLSEGCLKFSRKSAWENLNFTILENIWKDPAQDRVDYSYLREVNEILLERFMLVLNQIHNTNYSINYWRIFIGYWLKNFVNIYFDRWKTIKYVNEHYPNIKMNILSNNIKEMLPNDMNEFIGLVSSDIWNESIYSDIAQKWTNIKIEKLDKTNYHQIQLKNKQDILKTVIKLTFKIINLLKYNLSHKSKKAMYFIYYPYLNLKSQVQLGLKIKTSVIPFIKYDCPISDVDANLRKWSIAEKSDDLFISAITEILPKVLPKCFLEGYQHLTNFKTSWPDFPKVIMTANAFAYDQIWSAWAAKLVEKGSKLIIAQHGGAYGSSEFTPSFDHELKISDKYISWGWDVHNSKKIVKGPAAKLIDLRQRNKNLGNKCILVLQSESRYSIDVGFNTITKDLPKYLNDQFRFASTLSKAIQNELQIRLYFEDYGWNMKDRWKNQFPEVELIDPSIKIKKLLNNAKICVCTYNGTTFLETFTRNIPTILFWDPKIFRLNSDAQSFFDVLHRASILHFTPEDCAEFINSIWDDVPKWWNSIQVKQAIEIFSKRFAHVGPRPISQIKSILTDW